MIRNNCERVKIVMLTIRMVREARQSEEKYKYKYNYKYKYSNCSPSGACLRQQVEDQAAHSSPPLEPALLAI